MRAARNSFTGIETNPNVRWPFQTIDGILERIILKTCANGKLLARPAMRPTDRTTNFGLEMRVDPTMAATQYD